MFVESAIWESFTCGIWNLGLWNSEYNTRNPESYQRLESRIQVPFTKTGVQYLESGIHGEESRIQDYFGFPYMRRETDAQFWK